MNNKIIEERAEEIMTEVWFRALDEFPFAVEHGNKDEGRKILERAKAIMAESLLEVLTSTEQAGYARAMGEAREKLLNIKYDEPSEVFTDGMSVDEAVTRQNEQNRINHWIGKGFMSFRDQALSSLTPTDNNKEKCDNCKGNGWDVAVDVEPEHGCGGDEERCASMCPVPVQVPKQVPCEKCEGTGHPTDK